MKVADIAIKNIQDGDKLFMMDRKISTQALLERLRNERFYIYGTGFVANRFYEIIIDKNLEDNLITFVTTENTRSFFRNYKVLSIDNILENPTEPLICIAVHESNLKDIEAKLSVLGLEKSIWIYPNIFELWYGEPILRNVDVDIQKIIKTCSGDYRLPVRLLAIDMYYGNNSLGYKVYKKTQAIHSSSETAEKRLMEFIQVITNWDRNGYDKDSRLSIGEDFKIFDGVHRLSLACYHKLAQIRCDIYQTTGKKTYVNDEIRLTNDVIRQAKLSEIELDYLNKLRSYLQIHEEQ